MFEVFDDGVTGPAKRAAALAAQTARLAKRLQRAAESVDLHELRQRVGDVVARAAEAAAAVGELESAVAAPGLLFAGDQGGEEAVHQAYAVAFARACAALGVTLEGSYPDYQVFPFSVKIRLEEDRALIGKRSAWSLRPEALARQVRRERDRLYGASFAADRFGASLAKAYDILAGSQAGFPPVRLVDILELFQLGTFGRSSYTRGEFAFDLYRYRQMKMVTGGRRVEFGDMRGGGTGLQVPTARGTYEKLIAIRLLPVGAQAVGD